MFALVLPPVFVIAAIALLLYLFSRKLPEVERLERERVGGEIPGGLLSVSDWAKRMALGMVERFARLSKLFSLKIHNRLNALASSAHSARVRVADRIAERKQRESSASVAPMRRFLSRDRSSVGASYRETLSGTEHSAEEETLPPLVSEPLNPSGGERADRSVARRPLTSFGRTLGDTVRRLRPTKEQPVFPAVEPVSPQKKEQMEDILIERISLNPRDIEAYERLGDYYLEQQNLVDAKECYRQVLKLSPAYRLVKIKIRKLERLLEKD